MLRTLLLLIVTAAPGPGVAPGLEPRVEPRVEPGVVEQDGVRIAVDVDSNVYTWRVTNLSAADIVAFDIEARHMYNAAGPSGWTTQIGDNHFRAWTEDPRWALRPGQTERFTATVTVGEAWLGLIPVQLGVAGGASIVMEDVWGAVRLPRAQILLVAGSIVGLALMHLFLSPNQLN